MNEVTSVMTWNGEQIFKSLETDTGAAEKEVAELVYKYAKDMCPVGSYGDSWSASGRSGGYYQTRDEGTLKASITLAKSKTERGGWIVFVPAQGSATYYVKWIELGAPARANEKWRDGKDHKGHKVPRQPFLRPAREKARTKMNAIFEKRTQNTLA